MKKLAWALVLLALAGTAWVVTRSVRDREPARRTAPTHAGASAERSTEPPPPSEPTGAAPAVNPEPRTPDAPPAPPAPKPYRVVEETGDPERAALRVRVLDETERTVADAEVALTLSIDGVGRAGPTAKTDAAGAAAFDDLKASEVIAANVTVAGLTRSAMLRLENGRRTELVVRIRGGILVQGTIRDVESGPIPFVVVALSRATGDGFTDRAYGHTDKEGAYAIEGVPPGTYQLRISGGPSTTTVTVTRDGAVSEAQARPRRIEYHEQDQGEVVVTAPGPVRRDVVLGRLSIEGVVRDGATGAPIEGAEITFQSPHWAKTGTDAEGRFRVASMAPGKYTILLKKEGYALTFVRDVEIREGEVARVEFTMDRAARLHIHLQDDRKRPVSGMFWIRFDKPEGKGWSSNLVADAEGHVLSEVVPLGGMRISADGGGWKGGPVAIEIQEGENRVVVPLQRTGGTGARSLSGIVRDKQTGAPVAGAELRIRVGMPRIVYSGEDGKFVFEDLPPGSYQVHAGRDGYGDVTVPGVRIEAGKEARIEVELPPAATIHLRVTDSAGRPVAGKVLFAYGGGTPRVGRGLHLELDEDGRATFTRLPPGAYDLTVFAEGRGRARVKRTIQPGDNTIELSIEP